MPYAIALFEAAAFTMLAAAVTLAAALFNLSRVLAFAWRIWLWGSVGFVPANVVLLAILFPLSNVATVGGPPRHPDLFSYVMGFVLVGPLLFSSAGVILGGWYGWRLRRGGTQ